MDDETSQATENGNGISRIQNIPFRKLPYHNYMEVGKPFAYTITQKPYK